jgi:Sec-independent protein translocase protein TatA
MFGALGLPEILIILVIGVLIFGGVKMPGILRSISSGARGLRKVRDTVRNPIDLDKWIVDDEPEQGPPPGQQYYGYNQNPQGPGYQGQQPPPQWGPQQGQQPPPQWGPPNGQKPPNTPPQQGGPQNPDQNSDPPRT